MSRQYHKEVMKMAKKVEGYIKLQIPAGKATPAPPVGPALGQHGVNIVEFTKQFNARTADQGDLIIPVVITVYNDRSFSFVTKTPPAAVLIKKACNLKSGSGVPNKQKVAKITKAQLQEWVDYANKVGAVIIYDAAYEAYISEDGVPHSIYECEGARTCAIELRSFSKNAGFTGVRLGATIVPKDIKSGDVMLHSLWARRHGTKYNGAPYIVQKAGEAVYSEAGKAQLKEQVAYYMNNAKVIYQGLKDAGYNVSGGVNAPYIWLETPAGMTSWQFFDHLLEKAGVVGTPGSGFGPSGEGYFRLTAFGSYENTVAAIERIKKM